MCNHFRNAVVFPGQRVVTTRGDVVVVAFIAANGDVFAFGRDGIPVTVTVVCDAWGGEQDISPMQQASNQVSVKLAA